MATIDCALHGAQPQTFVCIHIFQALTDGIPRGFCWTPNDPAERPDAWCSTCNRLVADVDGDWERVDHEPEIKMLCGKCYDRAKAINFSG